MCCDAGGGADPNFGGMSRQHAPAVGKVLALGSSRSGSWWNTPRSIGWKVERLSDDEPTSFFGAPPPWLILGLGRPPESMPTLAGRSNPESTVPCEWIIGCGCPRISVMTAETKLRPL